jgi:hypothetical protein
MVLIRKVPGESFFFDQGSEQVDFEILDPIINLMLSNDQELNIEFFYLSFSLRNVSDLNKVKSKISDTIRSLQKYYRYKYGIFG